MEVSATPCVTEGCSGKGCIQRIGYLTILAEPKKTASYPYTACETFMLLAYIQKINTYMQCLTSCEKTKTHVVREQPHMSSSFRSHPPTSWILDFGSWILDFGIWILCILDLGFWILDQFSLRSFCGGPKRPRLDFGFWISDFGFRIVDFGFWILDFGFRILGLD